MGSFILIDIPFSSKGYNDCIFACFSTDAIYCILVVKLSLFIHFLYRICLKINYTKVSIVYTTNASSQIDSVECDIKTCKYPLIR